jgi:hypothetical protein
MLTNFRHITLSFRWKAEEVSSWLMFWIFPTIPNVCETVTFRGYFVYFFRWQDEATDLNPSILSLKRAIITVSEYLWFENPGTMGSV